LDPDGCDPGNKVKSFQRHVHSTYAYFHAEFHTNYSIGDGEAKA
jgi:hypothetical protein